MKMLWILFIGILANMAYAHNMSESTKKDKIIDALSNLSKNIKHSDIQISPAPLTPDFELQYSRFFESGDKTLEDFAVEYEQDSERYEISCDFLAGEYGRAKAVYFIVYRNCIQIDLNSYQEREIKLNTQFWNDWKY